MIKQKLMAIGMILTTLPVVILDGDCTTTIVMAVFAVPLFFTKERWID